jgi:hypothetical protein
MQASDRRATPRFRISVPLHFQLTKSSDLDCAAETPAETQAETPAETPAETRDISSGGVLMETVSPPRVGAILLIRIRLPEMIMGWRVPEWRITAHVVHVESRSNLGKCGVGIQFHYYEVAAPHEEPALAEGEPTRVLQDAHS